MIQFLTIKKHGKQRKDGRPHAQAFVVKKTRKYGEEIERKSISVKKPVLITGAHASGKSYWLDRLMKDAHRVWASRPAEPLYLAAARPLSAWTGAKQLELWWSARDNAEENRHWSKLKAWEKSDALPLYLSETGAVLFIDDAHNLSGSKLKLAQACVRSAAVWVITAADEGRISPGLRRDVLAADPQTFRLGTEVAYDGTAFVMYVMIAIFMSMGYWELAAVLGGLKVLGSGRRATKQA